MSNIKLFHNTGEFVIAPINRRTPCLFMDESTYARISNIVALSPREVSWFSYVEDMGENNYMIKDAYLVEQNVTGSETEMTTEGLSNFFNTIVSEKGLNFYKKIRCWGHSHVDFSVNPSPQDLKQIGEFANEDIYIMLIINKKGDVYSALYDFKNNMRFANIPVVLSPREVINTAELKKELKEKVSVRQIHNYHKCDPRNNATLGYISTPTRTLIDNQECFLEDPDEHEELDFPSDELIERVFVLGKEIYEDFKKATNYFIKAISFDEIIQLYCNFTKAVNPNEKQVILSDTLKIRADNKHVVDVVKVFDLWNDEIQEVISYTEAFDPDFDPTEYENPREYFEDTFLIEEDVFNEGDDIISDDPQEVNTAIIMQNLDSKEEK